MLALAVQQAKQEVTKFLHSFPHPKRPPFSRKRHKSIIYRKENAFISCLASKTGSDDISDFPIIFGSPINPLSEKTAQINYLRDVKYQHSLHGDQNRSDDICDFTTVFSIPRNPQRKRHRSSNKWQDNADPSCFWPIPTFGGSALFPFRPGNGHTDTINTNFIWCVITHDMKGVKPL